MQLHEPSERPFIKCTLRMRASSQDSADVGPRLDALWDVLFPEVCAAAGCYPGTQGHRGWGSAASPD